MPSNNSSIPRYDILRAEVDSIFNKHINLEPDFRKAHKRFSYEVRHGFSPLTECHALRYAEQAYHSDVEDIGMHFNVELSGWMSDLNLLIYCEGEKQVSKKLFVKTFKCTETATETMRVLNKLFNLVPNQ